jgi:hypothetical protein
MTNSPTALRRLLVLQAVAGLLITPMATGAQERNPDLLGIHVGMPSNTARTTLQKRMPQSMLQNDTQGGGFTLSVTDPMNRDMVQVFVTMEPNDPAVWMIRRTQNFSPQNPMTKGALLAALREKYGKETLTARGGSFLYWIFDQSGRLLTTADEGLTACDGNMFINNVRNGPPPSPTPLQEVCLRSFFAVTAMLNSGDEQLLAAYTIELVNLPYAHRAATATGHLRHSDAEKARQDLINKANRKPEL